jgi:hypothetical protein
MRVWTSLYRKCTNSAEIAKNVNKKEKMTISVNSWKKVKKKIVQIKDLWLAKTVASQSLRPSVARIIQNTSRLHPCKRS